jgi:hypothetical protein
MNFGEVMKKVGEITRIVGMRLQQYSQKALAKAKTHSTPPIAKESSFKQPPENLRQRKRGSVTEQEIKSFLEDYLEPPPSQEKDPKEEKPV